MSSLAYLPRPPPAKKKIAILERQGSKVVIFSSSLGVKSHLTWFRVYVNELKSKQQRQQDLPQYEIGF